MKKIVQNILPALLLVFAGLHSAGCSKPKTFLIRPRHQKLKLKAKAKRQMGLKVQSQPQRQIPKSKVRRT